jgi:hypothetical protein
MQRDPIAVEQEIRNLLGEYSVGAKVSCVVLWRIEVCIAAACRDVRLCIVLYCVLSYGIIICYFRRLEFGFSSKIISNLSDIVLYRHFKYHSA